MDIKFYETLSIGSRVLPCRQTDMMKLTVNFLNFSSVTKIVLDINSTITALLNCYVSVGSCINL